MAPHAKTAAGATAGTSFVVDLRSWTIFNCVHTNAASARCVVGLRICEHNSTVLIEYRIERRWFVDSVVILVQNAQTISTSQRSSRNLLLWHFIFSHKFGVLSPERNHPVTRRDRNECIPFMALVSSGLQQNIPLLKEAPTAHSVHVHPAILSLVFAVKYIDFRPE